MSKDKKYRLKNMTIDEVSIVDRGANPGADILFFKRNSDILDLGSTSEGETNMDPKELAKQLEQMQKQIDELTQKNDELKKASDEKAEIEKKLVETQKALDEEVEKGKKGKKGEMHEDDDMQKKLMEAVPAEVKKQMEDIKKQNESLQVELAKQKEMQLIQSFEKKADKEFPSLPGTSLQKALVLKHIDGVQDEDFKKYFNELLSSAEEAMTKSFKELGSVVTPLMKAESQLDALAKKYAEDNKVSIGKAMDAILLTAEGGALYKQMEEQKRIA